MQKAPPVGVGKASITVPFNKERAIEGPLGLSKSEIIIVPTSINAENCVILFDASFVPTMLTGLPTRPLGTGPLPRKPHQLVEDTVTLELVSFTPTADKSCVQFVNP